MPSDENERPSVATGEQDGDSVLPTDDIKGLLVRSLDLLETLADAKAPTLFVTDAQMFRRIGVPSRTARAILIELENKHGFPRKQGLWGGRRYWPAVELWFQAHNRAVTLPPGRFEPPDGVETRPELRKGPYNRPR
jgi:hypothetical protein